MNFSACLIPPYENYKLNSPHVASLYLEPIANSLNFEIKGDYYCFGEKERSEKKFFVVGWISDYAFSKIKEVKSYAHIVVDKYIFSSPELYSSKRKVSLVAIVKTLYRGFYPKTVFVNNKTMKSDFEYAFSELNVECAVFVLYHPVTSLAKLAQDDYVTKNTGDACFCNDTGKKLDISALREDEKNFFQKRVINVPYFLNRIERQGKLTGKNVVALLGCRPRGRFLKQENLSRHRVWRYKNKHNWRLALIFFLNSLVVSIKSKISQQSLVELLVKDIDSRWKPSTKVSSSLGQGLVLVSEFETSLDEMASKYGIPIYFFSSFSDLKKIVEGNALYLWKEKIEGLRDKKVHEINSDYLQTFLEGMRCL